MGNVCCEQTKTHSQPQFVVPLQTLVEEHTEEEQKLSVRGPETKQEEKKQADGGVIEAMEAMKEALLSAVEKVEDAILPETKAIIAPEPVKEVQPVVPPAPQKVTPLVVTFEKEAGKTVNVTFSSRPLGLGYGPEQKGACCGKVTTGKMVVTKVADKPELKNVKVGMVIKKVGGKDIPNKISMADMNSLMAKAAATLPDTALVTAGQKA